MRARECLAFVGAFLLAFGAVRAAAFLTAGFAAETTPQGLHRAGSTLVLPFDVTDGKASFLTVSNVSGVTSTGSGGFEGEEDDFDDAFSQTAQLGSHILGVSTHWAFWDESGEHLVDTFQCLTLNDTVVVDPRRLASQDVGNQDIGEVFDLSGRRGFVVVTTYATDVLCRAPSEIVPFPIPGGLAGSFTIADIASGSAFGHSALALDFDEDSGRTVLPNDEITSLVATTLNPSTLERADLILIALEEQRGPGVYGEIEVGPAAEPIRLSAAFMDTTEIPTSLPDVTIGPATFASISGPALSDESAAAPLTRLLPTGLEIESSGMLRMQPTDVEIGLDTGRLVIGFYGQTLGEFGGGAALTHTLPRVGSEEGFFRTFCCIETSFHECSGQPRAYEACRAAGGMPDTCCASECELIPGLESRACPERPTPTATPTATPDFEDHS